MATHILCSVSVHACRPIESSNLYSYLNFNYYRAITMLGSTPTMHGFCWDIITLTGGGNIIWRPTVLTLTWWRCSTKVSYLFLILIMKMNNRYILARHLYLLLDSRMNTIDLQVHRADPGRWLVQCVRICIRCSESISWSTAQLSQQIWTSKRKWLQGIKFGLECHFICRKDCMQHAKNVHFCVHLYIIHMMAAWLMII